MTTFERSTCISAHASRCATASGVSFAICKYNSKMCAKRGEGEKVGRGEGGKGEKGVKGRRWEGGEGWEGVAWNLLNVYFG